MSRWNDTDAGSGPLPSGITRRQWHELCDQLIELEGAGALGGIRQVVAERLARVRNGVMYEDPVAMALAVIQSVLVASAPGSPRHRQLLAEAGALLAAEIDRMNLIACCECTGGLIAAGVRCNCDPGPHGEHQPLCGFVPCPAGCWEKLHPPVPDQPGGTS